MSRIYILIVAVCGVIATVAGGTSELPWPP